MSVHSTGVNPDAEFLGKNRTGTLRMAGLALTVVGLVLSIIALATNAHRFAEGWLVGFLYVLTLCLGAQFFVMVQHLTHAGWSVGPRRQAEWIASFLQWIWVLFIPVAIFAGHLFEHWMGPEAAHDEALQAKAAYLNVPFFFVRAAFYFVVWFVLARFFGGNSVKQDTTGDIELTLKMERWSPAAHFAFGITLTFAAFDWIMSLSPHWFSTIFGVYVFSGAVTSSLAMICLFHVALQRAGVLGRVSTPEHMHDLGKLLFGFTVFFAYIGFSQFFLIWYANMPEETIFYVRRWFTEDGQHSSWMGWSVAIIFGHFWIPFFVLLSRHVKRSYMGLTIGAIILLVAHYIDVYWMVMPTFDAEAHFSWIDVGTFLVPVGLLLTWISVKASREAVYPLKDPRLPEAVSLVNL